MRIAEFTRHLLMPLAVIGLIPAAWAAVPVAVWEGPLDSGEKTGTDDVAYMLGVGESGGATVSWGSGRGTMTVIATVRGLAVDATKNQFLISACNSETDRVGITLGTDGKASGIWAGNPWNATTQVRELMNPPAEGTMQIALCHAYNTGTECYVKTDGGTWQHVYAASGLCSPAYDGSAFTSVAIGAPKKSDATYVAADMTIEKIELYSTKLTAGDLAGVIVVDGDLTISSEVSTSSLSGAGTITITETGVLVADTIASDAQLAVVGSGVLEVTRFNQVGATLKTSLQQNTWEGTLRINGDTAINDGTVNNNQQILDQFGNVRSKIELKNCTGYFGINTTNEGLVQPELVVTGTLRLDSGYSRNHTAFRKLSGTGTLLAPANQATQTLYFKDATDFVGSIETHSKRIVFGTFKSGAAYDTMTFTVQDGVSWTLQPGQSIRAEGGAVVDGELIFKSSGDWNDASANRSGFRGTGTISYEGPGFHTLPGTLWNSSLTFNNEQTSGVVIIKTVNLTAEKEEGVPYTKEDGTTTIGNLSGTKDLRSDWNGGGANDYRALKVVQSKNTTWSGAFTSGDRLNDFIVAGADGATEKTLTLAGTSTHDNNLIVEDSGAVALTGTWKGNVSVAGTIGGTGTVSSGTVTFADGATVKYVLGETALSATFTAAANATVKVTATADDLADKTAVKVLSWTTKPTIAFELDEGMPKGWIIIQKADGLYLSLLKPFILSIQ